METKMTTKSFDTDFVLINKANRYLHKDNKSTTDSLNSAKTYKTYQGAGKRCEGTNFKYIRVDEAIYVGGVG